MKLLHPLISVFLLSLQVGQSGLSSAQVISYVRAAGDDITVTHSFYFVGSRQLFCREECKDEGILIETAGVRAQSGRYSIDYKQETKTGGTISVSITQLTRADSGWYWCETLNPSGFSGFQIIVADALLDGGSDGAGRLLYAKPGGELTVACFFTESENRKYFCRGNCKGKGVLVETDGSSATRGRYSINYTVGYLRRGLLHVSISELRESDSGRYRCGLNMTVGPYMDFDLVVTDGLLLYVGLAVVAVLILLSLTVLIIFIRRRTAPCGLRTRGDYGGTNTEVSVYENQAVAYENLPPASTHEGSTYMSLHPATRDQDQIYSTLTQTQ